MHVSGNSFEGASFGFQRKGTSASKEGALVQDQKCLRDYDRLCEICQFGPRTLLETLLKHLACFGAEKLSGNFGADECWLTVSRTRPRRTREKPLDPCLHFLFGFPQGMEAAQQ